MTLEDDTTSPGPSSPAAEITKINQAYQTDDADLTIISADGIRFKVHRWVLILARCVHVTDTRLGHEPMEDLWTDYGS